MCIFALNFTHKNNHYVRHFKENNGRTSKLFSGKPRKIWINTKKKKQILYEIENYLSVFYVSFFHQQKKSIY
jgi:hypothetical protein